MPTTSAAATTHAAPADAAMIVTVLSVLLSLPTSGNGDVSRSISCCGRMRTVDPSSRSTVKMPSSATCNDSRLLVEELDAFSCLDISGHYGIVDLNDGLYVDLHVNASVFKHLSEVIGNCDSRSTISKSAYMPVLRSPLTREKSKGSVNRPSSCSNTLLKIFMRCSGDPCNRWR